jgi:autotransporter translocation and assembly factor TamB
MKRFLTYIGRFLLGLLIILFLLLAFSQTRTFKNILKNYAIRQANEILINTELTIDHIEGPLFNGLTLTNVHLIHVNRDTLFSIESASASYRILPLLKKDLEIKEIVLKNSSFQLHKTEDDEWNILKILPEPQDTSEKESSESFFKSIRLDNLSLENAHFSISGFSEKSPVPRKIRDVNLSIGLFLQEDSINAHLKHFRFRTLDPDFSLRNLQGRFSQSNELLREISFELKSELSHLTGIIETDTTHPYPSALSLGGDPIILDEFRGFMPDHPFISFPELTFTLTSIREKGVLNLELHFENQRIIAEIKTDSLTPVPVYQADIRTEHVNPAAWLKKSPAETDLNMHLRIQGKGYKPKTLTFHLDGDIETSTVNGYAVEPGKIEISKIDEELTFNVDYISTFGNIAVNGMFSHIFDEPVYRFTGNVEKLNPSVIFPEKIPESDLNLTLQVQGKGFNLESLESDIILRSRLSYIGELLIDTIDFSIHYQDEYLTIHRGLFKNSIALLELSGFADYNGETAIEFMLEPKELKPLEDWLRTGSLSARGLIQGRISGSYPDLSLYAELHLHNLRYNTMTLDALNGPVNVDYHDSHISGDLDLSADHFTLDNLTLDEIRLRSRGNLKEISNTLTIQSKDIMLNLETVVLSDTVTIIHIPDMALQFGPFSVNTTHRKGTIILDKNTFYLDSISVKSGEGTLNAHGYFNPEPDSYSDFHISLEDLEMSSLDTLDLLPYPAAGKVSFDIRGKGLLENPSVDFQASLRELEYKNQFFGDLDIRFLLVNNKAHFQTTLTMSPDEQLSGTFRLPLTLSKPFISLHDTLEFSLEASGLETDRLNTFNLMSYPLKGQFNGTINVSGKMQNPTAAAQVELRHLSVADVLTEQVSLDITLEDKRLNTRFLIQKTPYEIISGTADIPFYLFPDTTHSYIPGDEQVSLDFAIEELDLTFLESFSNQIRNLEGQLDMEIQMRNTLNQPEFSGNIALNKGHLSIPRYGLDYPEVRMNTEFSGNRITLHEFYIKGGDGQLVFSGNSELTQPLTEGIESFSLSVKGNQFTAAGSKDIFLLTDLDITLRGTPSNPVYDGRIRIPRGRLNLDVIQGFSSGTDVNEPMLVQAQKQIADTSVIIRKRIVQPGFTDNLTGKLNISIPKNTWIRNKNMNIEISGDLDLIKNGKDFELFGSITTLRGYYEQYGRKFDIKEGKITFEGGTEINPFLNLTINHSFRDINRVRRNLNVTLIGRMDNPEISFLLNDEEITEVDAISYLLFGRSSQEISQSQQNEVREQTGTGLAKSIIVRQLGGQLTGKIGKKLDLDVVEFAGGEDWKQASVYIGKYITDKLFLSYEKGFILGQTREITPDKVSAEYELNRHIFMQATHGDERTTGFDIIWKFIKR